jgi:hypothetical protein
MLECGLGKRKIQLSRGRGSLCVRVRPGVYCCRIAARDASLWFFSPAFSTRPFDHVMKSSGIGMPELGMVHSRRFFRLSSLAYLLRAARQLPNGECRETGISFHRRCTSSQNRTLPSSGGPPMLSTSEIKSNSGQLSLSLSAAPKYSRIYAYSVLTSS